MTAIAVAYLFGPEMDIAILTVALIVSTVMGIGVIFMAGLGMFSDPNYKSGDEDEDGGEY